MKIQLQATNLKLTENIRAYVEKRLRPLEKLIDPNDTSVLCAVEVELTTRHHKTGDIYRSEINLHIAKRDFRAEARKEKLYDAIDETKNQMTKELTRHKEKQLKSVRKGGAKIKELVKGG